MHEDFYNISLALIFPCNLSPRPRSVLSLSLKLSHDFHLFFFNAATKATQMFIFFLPYDKGEKIHLNLAGDIYISQSVWLLLCSIREDSLLFLVHSSSVRQMPQTEFLCWQDTIFFPSCLICLSPSQSACVYLQCCPLAHQGSAAATSVLWDQSDASLQIPPAFQRAVFDLSPGALFFWC